VASKGLEAVSGDSLRSDSAFMDANPATHSGVTVASVPPVIMTSVSPVRIERNAAPTAWPLEAHAETVA
jgi:hypothetical protein